ncbi:50S ribosomal protein L24 [Candidatus Woesearchaeota archaeon]|jgi:large subunit ribosomal protein L24|nr:50S ribosomal protein L24 [Candidatus Woesearchaeota archaeon]|tara:strand:+ start:1367 stop:1744 length:378 start_codon:yes stop_codon:yes gene_type:complete
MKTKFSVSWIKSKQPRKQRKYRYNAPLHIKQRFVRAHLSKELHKKYNKRNLGLKKGDGVKVIRGQFKNKVGKIEEVSLKKIKVYVTGIEIAKRDGTKTRYPIHPSNLIITEVNMDDKMRNRILGK